MVLILICLVSLLIAVPGFVYKAGYSRGQSFIPFYNLYLFFSAIEFPAILLLILALGIIFLPFRSLVATLLFVLLPFMVSDAYGKGKITGFLTLILPFIMYPVLGYFLGVYAYNLSSEKSVFIKKNKILCVLLVIVSFFVYSNFTVIIEGNSLVDKSSIHYVNDIYMSDARIYNNYLDDKQKKIYMLIFNAIKNFETKVEIKSSEFNLYGASNSDEVANDFGIAYEAVMVDHPELIQFGGCTYTWNDERLFVQFGLARSNLFEVKLGEIRINTIIDRIKKETKNMSDKEKIKYVYDWIGENTAYDRMFTEASKNQSIYNVFLKGNAVCAGFAKASQVIFQNIGIESYCISGQTSGPHMWNVVKLGDKYYYYDSTTAASSGDINDSWFYDGLIQSEMGDHIADYSDWYPEIATDDGLFEKEK